MYFSEQNRFMKPKSSRLAVQFKQYYSELPDVELSLGTGSVFFFNAMVKNIFMSKNMPS